MTRRLGVALAALLLAGCTAGGAAPTTTVTVLAAASLTGSFQRIAAGFESANPGTDVRLSFAASSSLAQQVVRGAPADVLATASAATMRTVTSAGLAPEPRRFARNRLVIAVPAGNPGNVHGAADLARRGVTVALCAPQVPCGAAAREALDAAGVTVRPATLERDVKAALTKVRLGEVDAALVYRTDARAAGAEVEAVDLPPAAARVANDYLVAALVEAPNPDGARRFVELVLSDEGRAVLAGAGFEVP